MFNFPNLTSLVKKNEHGNDGKEVVSVNYSDSGDGAAREDGDRKCFNGNDEEKMIHWKKAARLKFEVGQAASQTGAEDMIGITWLKNWQLSSILRESQNPNDCDRAVPSSIGDNSDNEDIQCRICDSLFESRRLLSQHKRLEHFPSWEGRNKEFCYVPYFVEPKRFNLLRGTLASGQSECDLCRKYSASVKQKMGPYLEDLRMKVKANANVESTCKRDWVTSTSVAHSKRRGRKCRSMTRRVCELCSKVLSNRKGLERHMLIHTGEKPFPCDTCGKPFRRKDNCVRHKKTAHLFKKPRKPRRRKITSQHKPTTDAGESK